MRQTVVSSTSVTGRHPAIKLMLRPLYLSSEYWSVHYRCLPSTARPYNTHPFLLSAIRVLIRQRCQCSGYWFANVLSPQETTIPIVFRNETYNIQYMMEISSDFDDLPPSLSPPLSPGSPRRPVSHGTSMTSSSSKSSTSWFFMLCCVVFIIVIVVVVIVVVMVRCHAPAEPPSSVHRSLHLYNNIRRPMVYAVLPCMQKYIIRM